MAVSITNSDKLSRSDDDLYLRMTFWDAYTHRHASGTAIFAFRSVGVNKNISL